MGEQDRPQAPGLKWRPRKGGDVAYWIAPAEATAAGFAPRSVRLTYDWNNAEQRESALAHCQQLQDEAALFISDRRHSTAIGFDQTFGALLDRYLTDPESSYARLKPGSIGPYTFYAAKLKKQIGNIRIDLTDGRDVQRWFKVWAGVDHLKHPDAKIPRARTTLAVLKAATTFGVICRLPGCADFATILAALEFPTAKPRTYAPTAAQVEAIRNAAHAAGSPSRALAYALQFETTLRQWDVTGVWVALADPRPSAVIVGKYKWLGPTWGMVDDRLVLRLTYGKTEDTSALRGVYDLSICPMVMEELQHVALPRNGPLIVDERTGLPYRRPRFEHGWRADFAAAGLPPGMWNRDLRAGADTEASMAGAKKEDRRKLTGHTTTKMLEQVYDRDRLGAQARVMELRVGQRKGDYNLDKAIHNPPNRETGAPEQLFSGKVEKTAVYNPKTRN